jgi:hypothetical protein
VRDPNAEDDRGVIEQSFTILNELGLHARAATHEQKDTREP